MEGTYPVLIDGVLAGRLTVSRQGALTAFDVRCRAVPGIVRLSVYGGGCEGYLGVLAPEEDGLGLHKTFSRNALRGFPQSIESVEPAGMAAERLPIAPQDAVEERSAPQEVPEAECGANCEKADCCCVCLPDKCEGTEMRQDGPLPDCAAGCGFLCGDAREDEASGAPVCPEADAGEDDLFWYASPDGALVCFDGTRSLIALPLGDERIPASDAFSGVLRNVEGREYMVFRTKNGKLVRD